MRDFHNGGNIRDVVINEGPTLGRPLPELTSAELREEREFRQTRLAAERRSRWNLFTGLLGAAVGVGLAAYFLYFVVGELNFVSVSLGVLGLALALVDFRVNSRPGDFERAHRDAIREIRTILRLRGER